MTIVVKNPEHQPRVFAIVAAVANVAEALGITLRVTDTIGSRHGKNSLHYALRAADFGCKEFDTETKRKIISGLREALGPGHDVIHEYVGSENEHIHVEYDPK